MREHLERETPRTFKLLCVVCGSNVGSRPAYAQAARQLGATLAERGIGLVYGGAAVGLMGAVADAAAAAGGHVVGVITPDLADQVGHDGIELERVETLHERKRRFAALADGYIALPGGLGTLEELFEAATWNQLAIHEKPTGLLNVAGYFNPLLAMLRHAQNEKFIRPEYVESILVDTSATRLIDAMARWQAPRTRKWMPD